MKRLAQHGQQRYTEIGGKVDVGPVDADRSEPVDQVTPFEGEPFDEGQAQKIASRDHVALSHLRHGIKNSRQSQLLRFSVVNGDRGLGPNFSLEAAEWISLPSLNMEPDPRSNQISHACWGMPQKRFERWIDAGEFTAAAG